jgi:hypothetical protein
MLFLCSFDALITRRLSGLCGPSIIIFGSAEHKSKRIQSAPGGHPACPKSPKLVVVMVDSLQVIIGGLLAALAGVAADRFWLSRHIITGRELSLERELAALRQEIVSVKEQLYESSRREAAALRDVTELSETVRNLTLEVETIRLAQTE